MSDDLVKRMRKLGIIIHDDGSTETPDELTRLRAENERLREALGLLDEQLDSHGFSVDGPMRRLISRTRAALQTKGDGKNE